MSVEDTGVGLSKEAQQRMFERFWREDASRTRASGGAGLGLAIARGFVEAQGGRIWAENRPEGGARFAFTLPIAERAHAVRLSDGAGSSYLHAAWFQGMFIFAQEARQEWRASCSRSGNDPRQTQEVRS